MMGRTLGIDLGTNSLGWAIVETNGEPGEDLSQGKIVASGVRIFSQSEFAGRDPQSKTSLAVARREARAQRRGRDRYLRRRQLLLETLIASGLMPAAQDDQNRLLVATADRKGGNVGHDVYALRAKALSEPLLPHQLGRVLFHIDQRRGFKSNRKTDTQENEAGKIAIGVSRLHQAMHDNSANTYGEFLHQRRLRGQSVRTRLRPETDPDSKGDGYDFYPSRQMLEDEFDAIVRIQSQYHSNLTPELARKLRRTIFYQRPLKQPLPGKCSYPPHEEDREPKSSLMFQEFRLLKEVNELRLIDAQHRQVGLTPEQRDLLLLELRYKKKVSFKTLQKRLKLGAEWLFNKDTENRSELLGDEVVSQLAHKDAFGIGWAKLTSESRNEIVEKLRDVESQGELEKWLNETHGLAENVARKVAQTQLPPGYGRFGPTALRNLIDEMRSGRDEDGHVITEAEASIRIYGKTNSERPLNSPGRNHLPPYQEILAKHIPPGTGNKEDTYDVERGRITNPTVHIALNQLRRVVNAIILEHGKPDCIAVELGRDMKLSDSARNEVNKEIGRNTREAIRRSEKLKEIGIEDNGYNRLRLKLWEELNLYNPEARVCIYTGQPIGLRMVFSPDTDVDHILPYQMTLDDSNANKILCITNANRQKGKRAPSDVVEWAARYDEMLARSSNLPPAKRWRFAPDAMSEFSGDRDFLARQLTDMQYVSRMALTYLAALYPAEEAGPDGVLRRHSRVRALPGKMTEMLRRAWSLNELLPDHNFTEASKLKNRLDHRHHAIDAVVIACTSRSLIQRLAREHGRNDATGAERIAASVPSPWETFRDDVRKSVQAIVVSHKPDHGTVSRTGYAKGKGQTAGKLHNDTAYGLTKDENGKDAVVHRAAITAFKGKADLAKIRDPLLRSALTNFVGNSEGKDFALKVLEFSRLNMVNGATNIWKGMRRVRILENLEVIPIYDKTGRAYKAYKGDSNQRYDVWRLKTGQWKSEVVSTFDAHLPTWQSPVRRENPTAKKVISVQQSDVLALDNGSETNLYRVVKFSSSGQLTLVPLTESGSLKSRDTDGNDPFKYLYKSASSLKEAKARQVRVTEAGRVFDPGPRT